MIVIKNARNYTGPGEYVGRSHPRFPKGSLLGNPYRSGPDGDRETVVARYRDWLRQVWLGNSPARRELLRLAEVYRQSGALTLICWCAPDLCHSEVIAQAIYEIAGELPPDITMPDTRLLITGSRGTTTAMLEYARQVVAEAKAKGWTIIVGDAAGVDAAVITECDRLNVPVIVHGAFENMRRRTTTGTNTATMGSFTARDRLMVERSSFCVAIWDGRSKGTRYTFKYARHLGRPTVVVDFSQQPKEHRPVPQAVLNTFQTEVTQMSDKDNNTKNFAILTLDIIEVKELNKQDGSGTYTVAKAALPQGDKAPLSIVVVAVNGTAKALQDAVGQSITLAGKLGYAEKADGTPQYKFFPWKVQESDKPRNFVQLTLRAGQEPDAKYSDAGNFWAKIRAALGFGKDEAGKWKPSMWMTVKAFTTKDGDEDVPTTLSGLNKGDLFNASGRLAYEVYNDKGYLNLNATKIEVVAVEEHTPATKVEDLPVPDDDI